MTAAERRTAILGLLETQVEPVNATALARQFSVSRQIIVGDVALLRAAGENVVISEPVDASRGRISTWVRSRL